MSEWKWDDLMHAGLLKASKSRICNCVGPKPGMPVCPCRMANLKQQDGRWIEIIDHGPVSPQPNPIKQEKSDE